MIIWIASYPKSGNTWLRTLISSYYYSKDGTFHSELIKQIGQFPEKRHFESFNYDNKSVIGTTQFWIKAQEKINQDQNIRFFKTHNVYGKINDNHFTNKQNSLGCIYIVRDPRNVITSMSNHYSLNYQQAFLKLIDENASLLEKSREGDYSNFTFLGSWSSHYKSWKNSNDFKTLFIKYEDLQNKKYETFQKVIQFINLLKKDKSKIDEKKFINSINSTNFSNLRNKEENEGFEESVYSNTGEKKRFFNLGFNNRWQKILPKDILNKLNKTFQNELNDLGYNLDD